MNCRSLLKNRFTGLTCHYRFVPSELFCLALKEIWSLGNALGPLFEALATNASLISIAAAFTLNRCCTVVFSRKNRGSFGSPLHHFQNPRPRNIGHNRCVILSSKKEFFIDTDLLDLLGLSSLKTSSHSSIHDALNAISILWQNSGSLFEATAGNQLQSVQTGL